MTAKNRTKKHHSQKRKYKEIIVQTFLELLNQVKLYHWKTHDYAVHKATDELYTKLDDDIDKFIEVLLGKDASRIHHSKSHVTPCSNTHQIKKKIHEYQDFLLHMNQVLDPIRDTDLLNIRDEILADLNQFLYLLTLNGGGMMLPVRT